MFSNATHWMNSLENLRAMWIENDAFDAVESLRESAGDIAHLLATSSAENTEGGTAGLLLLYKTRKDQELIQLGKIPPPTPENILELGYTVDIDDEGMQFSPIVKYFEESLKKFAFQKQTMTAIPVRSVINNILIDTSYLKSVLEPSPDRCFNNVAKLLPGIARDKNELLLTEVQTWVRVLNTEPATVEGFVEYLGWLEKGSGSLTQCCRA
jgi:dynein heavy chain, axonemal